MPLKGRWTIDKKYIGREIWMAFPINDDWYLMRRDDMLQRCQFSSPPVTEPIAIFHARHGKS